MPGWIIQGVRGEGKGLAAVHLIKKYLDAGRPVATNMDLFLEHLTSPSNSTPVYRLPDYPRASDLAALPPAFSREYKGEDQNGLMVLDELGTWMNSRTWSDKDRKDLLNWLFLSRKDHWDLAILAQNVDMIDKQASDNLCDYLVQSSRTDRKRVPYIGNFLKFLGFSGNLSRSHVYHVFYGLSLTGSVHEVWSFTGKDYYNAYDTNQRFTDGKEAVQIDHLDINGEVYKTTIDLVDFRALYTYLPASYLTGQHYIQKHLDSIDIAETEIKKLQSKFKGEDMARSRLPGQKQDDAKAKMILMTIILFLVSGYGFYKYYKHSNTDSFAPSVSKSASPVVQPPVNPVVPVSLPVQTYQAASTNFTNPSPVGDFLSHLLVTLRPRLTAYALTPSGPSGYIDFYDKNILVERLHFNQLRDFGVSVIKRSFGVELVTSNASYKVTSWRVASNEEAEPKQSEEGVISKLGL